MIQRLDSSTTSAIQRSWFVDGLGDSLDSFGKNAQNARPKPISSDPSAALFFPYLQPEIDREDKQALGGCAKPDGKWWQYGSRSYTSEFHDFIGVLLLLDWLIVSHLIWFIDDFYDPFIRPFMTWGMHPYGWLITTVIVWFDWAISRGVRRLYWLITRAIHRFDRLIARGWFIDSIGWLR